MQFLRFLAVAEGLGPARKLGETLRIHSAKFRCQSAVRSPRNDEKRVFKEEEVGFSHFSLFLLVSGAPGCARKLGLMITHALVTIS